MNARSAASSAPECFTLISYCEFMNSWLAANASRPSSSHQRSIFRTTSRGSETDADGVDARELVLVAADAAVDGGVALDEEELELGSDDRVKAALGIRLDDATEQRARARRPVRRAVQRPRLAEAPRHLGLPRNDPQRVEVGPHREVDVSHLAADDGRVAEIGAHDRSAERRPLLGQPGEVAQRDVLAACDAVEVGVEHAHGFDSRARGPRAPPRRHALEPVSVTTYPDRHAA